MSLKTIHLILIIIFFCCSGNQPAIISSMTGKTLSNNGKISDSSLIYRFKRYRGNGKSKDLFNYIYFKGDTLCFSVKLNKKINLDNTRVWFVDPKNATKFKAERIEIKNDTFLNITYNNRLYGFSLLGSILENYFKDRLQQPIPANAFCCKDIPFKIVIEIMDKQNKTNYEISSNFRIEYK